MGKIAPSSIAETVAVAGTVVVAACLSVIVSVRAGQSALRHTQPVRIHPDITSDSGVAGVLLTGLEAAAAGIRMPQPHRPRRQ